MSFSDSMRNEVWPKKIYELFWDELVSYTVDTASSRQMLMKELTKLVNNAVLTGFIPPKSSLEEWDIDYPKCCVSKCREECHDQNQLNLEADYYFNNIVDNRSSFELKPVLDEKNPSGGWHFSFHPNIDDTLWWADCKVYKIVNILYSEGVEKPFVYAKLVEERR